MNVFRMKFIEIIQSNKYNLIMKSLFTLLIIILIATEIKANDYQNKIDSLKKELDKPSIDDKKRGELNKLIGYIYTDYIQDRSSALPYFLKAEKLLTNKNEDVQLANIKNNIGVCYEILGNHKNALLYFNDFLKLSEKLNDLESLSNAYKNIGMVYEFSSDYENAVKFYIKASEVNEKLNDTIRNIDSYINIGGIYRLLEQFNKANDYFNKALNLNKQKNDDLMFARIYNQMAITAKSVEQYDTALIYYQKSLSHSKAISWKKGIAAALSNIGNVYNQQEKYDKALKYHLQSLEIENELNHYYGILMSKEIIGELYIKLNNYKLAEKYISETIADAKKDNNISVLMNSYSNLYELSKLKNNYIDALRYLELSKTYNDSLYNIESVEKISEIETKYQTAKKEHEIEVLNFENQIKKEQIQKKDTFIYSAIAISLSLALSLLIVLYILRQKTAAYKALVRINKEASKCDRKKEQIIVEQVKQNEIEPDKNGSTKLIDDLMACITIQKPYLNTNCTIDELAKQLNTNRQYLSQAINQTYHKNFNNFINEFRIKEARKMLIDDKNNKYTIEGISKMVGFNSRNTFINSFKKYTGVTPSYFKAHAGTLN